MVEDDVAIARELASSLIDAGYDVQVVRDASSAIAATEQQPADLVLLDLGLPDADGLDVCRVLRTIARTMRIVVVTARAEERDVVIGLDAGADDYLIKPFRLTELLARVRAQLRRPDAQSLDVAQPGVHSVVNDVAGGVVEVGGIRLDRSARRVQIRAEIVELRPKEFDLLALLMAEAGRVVTREQIMERIWDEHWFGSTKTLDMHILTIRKKIASATGRITTLRHVGYRFDE